MCNFIIDLGDVDERIKDHLEVYKTLFREIFFVIKDEAVSKKDKEIYSLQEQLSNLKSDVCTLKEWQQALYLQMQNMYSNYDCCWQSSMNVDTSYSETRSATPDKVDQEKCQKKNLVKTVKSSDPVFYGDSPNSKKLKDRKQYKANVETQFKESNYVLEDSKKICDSPVAMKGKKFLLKQSFTKLAEGEESSLKAGAVHDEADLSNESCNEEKSLEETLKRAAESAVSKSGLVFDASSGLYYDWNLKMYYDPSTKLFYDHQNGIYYYYDSDKRSYIFHSQIDLSSQECTSGVSVQVGYNEELSDGEIAADLIEADEEEIDPCVRIIVMSSDYLVAGTLYIVTVNGGTIGNGKTNLINIETVKAENKTFAEIIFDKTDKTFYLRDEVGDSNISINGEKLGECSGDSIKTIEIAHRDLIKICETIFSFHIHVGHNTCEECEPGVIKSKVISETASVNVLSKEELNKLRKLELKQLKKKFGLTPGYNQSDKLIALIPNRAQKRHNEVGIEAYEQPLKPTERASVHTEIPESNKGHKMLAKMGWKSGEGLGKKGTGVTMPVTISVLEKNKGLGMGAKKSMSDVERTRKEENWDKARKRFNKL